MSKLLSVCELAQALGRSERYVWYMRQRGFSMPGGRAYLSEAREFLKTEEHPCRRKCVKLRDPA